MTAASVPELEKVTGKKAKRVRKVKVRKGSSFLHRHFPLVEKVVDSKKSVTVSVVPDDCVAGQKGQPTECALARAAKREFEADGIIIGMSYSYIIKGKVAYRFATSVAVGREITSFDRDGDFEPGNYLLSKVSPSGRLGTSAERRARYKGHGGGNHDQTRIVHTRTARVRSLQTA